MNDIDRRHELSLILEYLVEELDVPPSKYEEAKKHYDSVGAWLNEHNSELVLYDPNIYPQGSFALGTAVKPLGDDDYDVDAVCLLMIRPTDVTQQELKEMVGRRLKTHDKYKDMLDPQGGGRRCWTLKYADSSKFHLDILPAIPDDYRWLLNLGVPSNFAKHAICITDRETWYSNPEWPRSNPIGYQEWFKEQMRIVFEERRRIVALEKRAQVQEVPDYEVRTPLQRIIQLLKRHRDQRYKGDDDKPVSIIITTLAARAYDNQTNIVESLLTVVPKMREYIEQRANGLWVPNPVNPKENFADKWSENPRKQQIFFEWLDAVENEHQALLDQKGFERIDEYFREAYGERETTAAMKKYSDRKTSQPSVVKETRLPSRFDVPHRESAPWPIVHGPRVQIHGRFKHNGMWHNFSSDSSPLPKSCDLLFQAHTDVIPPYSVYWQVVNTGQEAKDRRQLRGQIFPSKTAGIGGLTQKEATAYTGMHWVQCFIVKNNKCVALSSEFVVNIL